MYVTNLFTENFVPPEQIFRELKAYLAVQIKLNEPNKIARGNAYVYNSGKSHRPMTSNSSTLVKCPLKTQDYT